MKDRYGRTIDYVRVSLTDRCNLRCIYCMPEEGIKKVEHNDIMRFEEVLTAVKALSRLGIKKVRYTGGEPLILKDIGSLIYETSKIHGINDISITTNGIMLNEMAEELKSAGLKRINISLDTLNGEKYKKITRGGDINKVFRAIEKCSELGIKPVKINTVLMRGINDDEISDFIDITRNIPVEVRFIELMPIGEGVKYYEKSYLSSKEVIQQNPELIPLSSDENSTAVLYKLKDAKGSIGFISPMSCKFCSSCNRIRLTSMGTIKPCLHSREEISIKEYLNSEEMLVSVLKSAVFNKPEEHHLNIEEESQSSKMMFQIGG